MWPEIELAVDGPGRIDSDRFDIVAKTRDGIRPEFSMLQSVLAERFKVKVQTEPIERPLYELVVANNDGKLGPQLKASTRGRPYTSACAPARIAAGPTIIQEGVTMPEFAAGLRVVRDRTG